jgi:hypothetical protein
MTERFEPSRYPPGLTRVLPVLAVLIGLGIGAYFLFSGAPTPPPTPPLTPPLIRPIETPQPADAQTPTPDTTPGIPATEATSDSARIPEAPALQIALPGLADSDAEVRERLRALLGDGALAAWLKQDNLLQRIDVLIAGLARGEFALETLLLEPPPGGFQVDVRDGGTYVSPRNYARYNPMVGLLDGLDVTALAEFFQRYRPLLEAAYGELGEPPEQLDTAVLGAIDHLLGTPEIAEPPALAQESVAYTYADLELEQLSAARRQLLRMGPEHTRTLKVKLNALRAALVASPPGGAAVPAAVQHSPAPN